MIDNLDYKTLHYYQNRVLSGERNVKGLFGFKRVRSNFINNTIDAKF